MIKLLLAGCFCTAEGAKKQPRTGDHLAQDGGGQLHGFGPVLFLRILANGSDAVPVA